MGNFLLWIGLYNLLGSFILMAFHFEKIGDTLLRKWTEIINIPYTHGNFGRMWLWWTASANLFIGLVMLLATRWSLDIQKEITILVLIVYIIMYIVMLLGGKKPKFGRGIYITHALWMAQIAWGIWVILSP